MMALSEKRAAIRHLLNDKYEGDALASYFAFYHPDERTQIVTYPSETAQATGYITLARTGMDLFRPLMTLRLPPEDMSGGMGLMYEAMVAETAVIAQCPYDSYPLLQAFFDIHSETTLHLWRLDPEQFTPSINVMVTQKRGANGLPLFSVRSNRAGQAEVAATAGLNWQTPYYVDLFVDTNPRHRRQGWGRSVVGAAVQLVLANSRIPLYAVETHNTASIRLAESLGFVDTGIRQILFQGILRSRPN